MKRLVSTLVTMGCVLAGGVGAQDPPAPSGVRVEPAVMDFGLVYAHQPVRGEVLVLNEGDRPFGLEEIGKSCPDCLEVFPGVTNLVPGEATTLGLWFDPCGQTGEIREFVVLEGDGPVDRSRVVEVRASVSPAYQIDDGSLLLEAENGLDAVSAEVRVRPLFSMQGHLDTGHSVRNRTRVEIRPDEGSPGAYRVRVTAVPPITPGMEDDELILTSSHGEDPPCHIPAAVFLMPRVHVYPGRLLVADTDREQLRILFIESRDGGPVELLSVQAPDEHVRWEYFPGYGLEKSRVNVYINGAKGLDGGIGEIELHLRGAEEKRVGIPILVDPGRARTVYFTDSGIPLASRKGCGCGRGS